MTFHNVPPNGFPDLPDVEELEAVVKDVTSLKTSVAGLTEDVGDLNDNKANQITIAPFFSAETAYEVGDLVYYNGLSYRCTNDHEGEWDADDFAATTIENELTTLKSGLTNLIVKRQQTITIASITANSRVTTSFQPEQVSGYVWGGFTPLVKTDGVMITIGWIGNAFRIIAENLNDSNVTNVDVEINWIFVKLA